MNGDLWRSRPALADELPLRRPRPAVRRALAPAARRRRPVAARDGPDRGRLPRRRSDLEDVTVVANDTGGAVAQWLVGHHPERVGGLVLTSCDAFEKFPPTPQRYLELAARSRRSCGWSAGRCGSGSCSACRPRTAGSPAADRPGDHALVHRSDPHQRRRPARPDAAAAGGRTRYTYEAAGALRGFDKPALVLWAEGDKIFPREHGRRLAELLPQGRFELVPDSRTFIPEDQPERLALRVREFLG